MFDTGIFLIEACLQEVSFISFKRSIVWITAVFTPGKIAQLVVYRLNDSKVVGSILDSAQKYFPFKKARNNIISYGVYCI